MEQGEIGFLVQQHRQEIGERRQDGEADIPAIAVLRSEQRHLPDDIGSRDVDRELTMHRLGDNQADIMGEAIRKPLTRVRDGIGMTERGLHPHLAFAYFNTADGQVICPQVEGAAAFEIEASVVPMTGQDPVVDTAALEREAHVWATIVECEDASAVVDKEDRTMDAMHNQPPFRFQLLKARRERKFLDWRIHEHTSRVRLIGVAAGPT